MHIWTTSTAECGLEPWQEPRETQEGPEPWGAPVVFRGWEEKEEMEVGGACRGDGDPKVREESSGGQDGPRLRRQVAGRGALRLPVPRALCGFRENALGQRLCWYS